MAAKRKRKSGRRWIKKAIKRPGALRAKAKRAGVGTMAYARSKRNAPDRTGKQARLALTLRSFHR